MKMVAVGEDISERAATILEARGFEMKAEVVDERGKLRELNYLLWVGKGNQDLELEDAQGGQCFFKRKRS